MGKRKRFSLADPTAREALNRVTRRLEKQLRRAGYELVDVQWHECNDPACLGH